MSITVNEICRYPVKGLNADRLDRVTLAPGEGLPHDRRFAIAHGSMQFDPKNPTWQPKTNFLMLMRDEKLAQLDARFDAEAGTLTIERDGKQVVRAEIASSLGKALIGQFFAGFMGDGLRGAPKVLEAEGHMFSDCRDKVVSIIGLASVRDLERVVRQPVDPQRFRGNLYIEGSGAWQEFEWIGRELAIGQARLKVEEPIERCAATNVDPKSAARDMNLPLSLQRGFGHVHMGIYARVIEGGDIATGDTLELLS